MPKGKRKGKSDRHNNGSGHTSDEDSYNENASVFSNCSEASCEVEGEEVEEDNAQEEFEDKLIDLLDGLTQKSSQGRTTCLDGIRKSFIRTYEPDSVYDRRVTLCDAIERSLKKGKGAEQAAAAQLAPLVCVQLGAGDTSEWLCNALKPVLLVTANDKSVTPVARANCCTALGLMTFLAGGEMGDVIDLMRKLQSIFAGSYLKGDGCVPNVSVELGALHAAALSSWTLLFTLMSPSDVCSMMDEDRKNFAPSIQQLSELLSSPHLDVRLSAGEALATVFQVGRDYREDFADSYVLDLVAQLRQLATDSHKYRAKKDRKQQRATFRDIVTFIDEDRMFENVRVKFGTEVLILDSWARRKQYDALCTLLGSGLNTHLCKNELLRDIFELGDPLVEVQTVSLKQSKLERHLFNAAAFKARTITRGKNRDKRSDF